MTGNVLVFSLLLLAIFNAHSDASCHDDPSEPLLSQEGYSKYDALVVLRDAIRIRDGKQNGCGDLYDSHFPALAKLNKTFFRHGFSFVFANTANDLMTFVPESGIEFCNKSLLKAVMQRLFSVKHWQSARDVDLDEPENHLLYELTRILRFQFCIDEGDTVYKDRRDTRLQRTFKTRAEVVRMDVVTAGL